MGIEPWKRWTDTPSAFVREYFFERAYVAEAAEIGAHNMRQEPHGDIAHLVVGNKLLGGGSDRTVH